MPIIHAGMEDEIWVVEIPIPDTSEHDEVMAEVGMWVTTLFKVGQCRTCCYLGG
jgi:hypothetical protein